MFEEIVFLVQVFGVWIAFGLILGLIGSFSWNNVLVPRRWPYKVIIREERNGNLYTFLDWGRVDVRKGGAVEKLILRKEKREIKPPEFKNISSLDKNMGLIDLFSPNRLEYFPVKFEPKEKVFNVVPEDMKYWFVLDQREAAAAYAKKPGFLEKWGPFMMFGVLGVLMVVMLVYGGQNIVALSAQANAGLANVADKLALVAEKLSPHIAEAAKTAPPAGLPAP